MSTTAAIILAGGSGSRVQRDVNKVYLSIRGRPMLSYALQTFDRSRRIYRIVVVVREEDRDHAEHLVETWVKATPFAIVVGGATRALSEYHGLEAVAGDIEAGALELVAIHDGARPFLTLELLDRVIDLAASAGGAIPCLPVEAPVFGPGADGAVLGHQGTLHRAQTPQVFRARELLEAYRLATAEGFSGADTAETVEAYSNLRIGVVEGDPRNLKVTFVEDFFGAEELALSWEVGRFVAKGTSTKDTL